MLQQTRVEAVIPYYEKFLGQFPTVHALASADDSAVLAAWAGLGYYSRARQLHKAAKLVSFHGLPQTHQELLALPGIGPYTAAAVGSISLGLAHAAVDGNVLRVVSRLTNDPSDIGSPATRARFQQTAQQWLNTKRPGDFNQAMMELGATICTPRNPRCEACPVRPHCAAHAAGTQRDLPIKLRPVTAKESIIQAALCLKNGKVLLTRRTEDAKRMAGFWELPALPSVTHGTLAGRFTHQIVNDRFRVEVWRTNLNPPPPGSRWIALKDLPQYPVTTVTKKALAL